MPVVTITLMKGYDVETRERLAQRLTNAVLSTIAAPCEGTTVMIYEVDEEVGYRRGGIPRTPGAPLPSPAELVQDFLAAMEARDLERARSFLDKNFEMTFPGGATFGELEELVEWAKPRYKSVRKVYDRFDEAITEQCAVVYCFGTLEGEWPDGSAFAGIRFIDRFSVAEGKLQDQRVWNDMGEARA